ncbi:YfaZ family outer membrane protein [Steroidobacter cummioxidans]|uniref:YfaZ family outer membrane protein n=1 Tax=Steroidobacter cummioxidans TaxID=1803913 RepID=UPI000E30B974|nr:YfaZ family outer membrane protein [Steroidobacter cummioxidans]
MFIGYAQLPEEMEKNMRIYLAIIVLMAAAGTAMAQRSDQPGDIPKGKAKVAEVQVSSDTLQLRYIANGKIVGASNSRFSGTFFLSEDRDIVLSSGLVFPVDYDLGRLSLLIGPQVYAAFLSDPNEEVMALSLGADLRFVLNKKLDFAVSGQAYYAPNILTFGSADELVDLSARAEIALAKNFQAFGGYRWFHVDLTSTQGNSRKTLQNQVFFGLAYRF